MENLIHKITIREWSYFSKSNDKSGLKKYKIKDFDQLIQLVESNLGENHNLEKQKDNLNSKYKIQELIIFYKNLNNLLVHKLKVELWLLELGIDVDVNEKLDETIKTKTELLKSKYGIEVKEVEDLKKIDNEIVRRLDKYAELNQEVKVVKGLTFSELVIRIFKILEYDKIDYDMVLSDFFELKKQALKQAKI